jgi:hypothetical protein
MIACLFQSAGGLFGRRLREAYIGRVALSGRDCWKETFPMYRDYFIQLGLSAIAMFLAMYAMIASLAHFTFNLNTVYMTLLMGRRWRSSCCCS